MSERRAISVRLWALIAAATVAGTAAVAAADLSTGARTNLAPLYAVTLVAHAWLRRRGLLWAHGLAAAALVFVPFLVGPAPTHESLPYVLLNRTCTAVAVLILAPLISLLITTWWRAEGALEALDRSNRDLESANRELAAREEETARQNEELQSQAAELEQQSEELRAGNEELARHERTLRTLLDLSRSLTTELSRDETLRRVCGTLGQLVDLPGAGAAILEREGDDVVVRCHRGFGEDGIGPEGIRSERFPAERSFAALVMARGRTGYLEDLALRPDLEIPQPAAGAPFASVLAAPLRVADRAVGTIEVYARQPYGWNEEQLGMVESLAAQVSVSLEAAELFARVERERHRLDTILRTMPIGVLVAEDPAGERITGNPAMAAMYSVPADTNFSPIAPAAAAAVRRRFFREGQPLRPEDLPLMRALRTGDPVQEFEMQVVLPGGDRTVSVLMSAAPFLDAEGRVVGGAGALVDITRQKQLQAELDARRREAEETSVRKTRFLAAISHDIRTPANAISLLAELIRRSASNPAMVAEIPELAEELHASAMALVGLLGDMLDLARFDTGRIDIQETEFSLGDLLAEEDRRLAPLARDKGLDLKVVPAARPLRVRADRIKLSRVIDNLIGNAVKFTEAGEIRLEAARLDDGRAQVRVTDTGIGIEARDLANIFDEFFQLRNPERDRTKGTGLGLAICRRLVDAMGGELTVHSEPGRGSTFAVTLPATAVRAEVA